MGDYIEIKDFPNDVYAAVGRIIKASQELERDFKALAERLALPVKNINGSSLNKLNDALKVNGIIDNTLYEKLKKVIFIRNYINHTFFVKDFASTAEPFDRRMKTLGLELSSALFVIYEANDVISNISDKLDGLPIVRPTVFDEK